MNSELLNRAIKRKKRALRVRKSLRGDGAKPRMCVVKSNRHIAVQLIDDKERKTLFGISTYSKELQSTEFNKKSKASAKHLGTLMAQESLKRGIEKVIFDRGPFKYHGIIAELANAARDAGLQF